jgi:hypothetical protein
MCVIKFHHQLLDDDFVVDRFVRATSAADDVLLPLVE